MLHDKPVRNPLDQGEVQGDQCRLRVSGRRENHRQGDQGSRLAAQGYRLGVLQTDDARLAGIIIQVAATGNVITERSH